LAASRFSAIWIPKFPTM